MVVGFHTSWGIERFDVTPAKLEVGSVDPCINNSIFYRNQLDVTFLRLFVFFMEYLVSLFPLLIHLVSFFMLCFIACLKLCCFCLICTQFSLDTCSYMFHIFQHKINLFVSS